MNSVMKMESVIRERLVEVVGEIRNIDNKIALDLDLSMEAYEALDSLVAERDALTLVLGD
jgi:hypothetical protein